MDNQCLNLHNQVTHLAEGMAVNRTEHKSFLRRLDELEESSKRQNAILITLQRQADAIEAMNGKMDHMAENLRRVVGRVDQMEKEPGESWKKIGFEIIKYIVLAAVGAAVGFWIR